jgi:DNA invertase Pin-like site-specific DNA recombinase
MSKQLIGYIRVSSKDQGRRGNGLEAQQADIRRFAEVNGYEIVDIVTEVARGWLPLDKRDVLNKAINKSLKENITLVVSKLDRLSRDAVFIMQLMTTKLKFVVAQLGENVDKFMLHIYAVVAQKEREMISERTKAALGALKAKGVKLGGPKQKEASIAGGEASSVIADEFASKIKPLILSAKAAKKTLAQIAEEFNNMGVPTARGGKWGSTQLSRICVRLGI